MLDMVVRKLPVNMLREWVKVRATARVNGMSYLETMQEFMRDERDNQCTLSYLMDTDL